MKQDATMAVCDSCFWEKHPDTVFGPVVDRRKAREAIAKVKAPPPVTKPEGATGQEPTQSTSGDSSTPAVPEALRLLRNAIEDQMLRHLLTELNTDLSQLNDRKQWATTTEEELVVLGHYERAATIVAQLALWLQCPELRPWRPR